MLFCSLAAYGGYPCFTHLLMYYRGKGNGNFPLKSQSFDLDSLKAWRMLFGAFACIFANALLFASNTLQQLLRQL